MTDEPEARDDVDTAVYWSVDDCRWESVEPTLPDDLVDLLAPPIVVGAVLVGARSASAGPGALEAPSSLGPRTDFVGASLSPDAAAPGARRG